MKELQQYTQEEISSALSILNKKMDSKILDRKALNQEIRDIRANIKYYEELDQRQYKLV